MATTNIQSFSGDVEVASDLTVTSNLTVDTNTLHVDSVAGRVGIGKTNPAFEVDVNGTLNATSLYLGGSQLEASPWTQDNSNIYYTSNVGIGTNAPGKTLEVQGTLRVSDSTIPASSDLSMTVNTTVNLESATEIESSDAQVQDKFGWSVDISADGSYAIIGAINEGGQGRGAAYVFEKTGSTWNSGTKLVSSDLATYDCFGATVRISNDGSWAMAAAPYAGPGDVGYAYVFKKTGSTWDSGTKLVSPSQSSYGFGGGQPGGSDLSRDGSWVVISSYGPEKAIVFKRTSPTNNTWDSGVLINTPSPGKRFGQSCAISGDGSFLVVGAPYGHPSDGPRGSAYIYKRSTSGNTWGSALQILAPDAASQDRFGTTVDISGDGSWVIVGSPYDDPVGVDSGSIYIYQRTHPTNSTWGTPTKVGGNASYVNLGNKSGGIAGIAISDSGDAIIAGNPYDDTQAYNAGVALYFQRTHPSNNTWGGYTFVYAPDAAAGEYFGSSVALGSSDLVCGAYLGGITNNGSGTAYIFAAPGNTLKVSTAIEAGGGSLLSFTGQHICFPEGPMSQGLVVSANKNKYMTLNGPLKMGAKAIKSSESLPVVSLSKAVSDRSAFGVVDHFENGGTSRTQKSGAIAVRLDKELGDNRVIVNSLGEGAMWVANTNGPLESGDYITTSNIAGYGQRQDDDILHSYTVAKITMDCDFDPEDVPIRVIKKDENGQNILDEYGRIQWEEVPDQTEKEYRIRYLTTDGSVTDEANAVWKAAYVGCTYHCG